MKNLKNISKRIRIIMIFSILLSGFVFLLPYAGAVSAEKGNFVTLGRTAQDGTGHKQIVEEKISLWVRPGINEVMQARLESGTVVLVLDKATVQGKTFYIVSTVGKDGGVMGWVNEEYIYEIVSAPEN